MNNDAKQVVIIGGSQGIGFAIAKAALAKGMKVLIASRSLEKLKEAQKKLAAAEIAVLDISQEEDVKQFFNKRDSFDHLITTGGITSSGLISEFPTKEARKSFDSKFWGQYFAAKYGASKIKKGGSIVFFSGILAHKPIPGLTIMGIVNGAVESLTKGLAVELGPHVRVNAICPGLIETPAVESLSENVKNNFKEHTCVKRTGRPDEIAEGALYLMECSFVTGTILFIDGGYFLK